MLLIVLLVLLTLHVLFVSRVSPRTRCARGPAGVDGFVVAARDMYVASLVSVVGIVSDT